MNAAELAEYVRRLVDEAPPMTERQRSNIAALLRSGLAENAPAGPAIRGRERAAQARTRAA
jgi:hypothetical protein